ncbi:terminase [Mycolicibacterium sp.]|uniref:terminase n=1 Tax=Mycolicibacterium sp. TaxID=2320850 RepID=UPI0028B00AE8|nr:terminase [Mycolicibacterium sp.]
MILGAEVPRIFTPPKRDLTPETTHGFAAIAFAEDVLGVTLFPWQRWLLIHALELEEQSEDEIAAGELPRYRFRFCVVEVARQNGKTLLMLVLALWHIYALDSPTVIGTAQDLANAEKAWGEAVEWAQSDEELGELIEKVNQGHPKFMKLVTGCQYRVAAASRKGGRGFSGDLVLLDELREHQSWDSWSAVTNTMNARPRAQAWAFSNAGDALSVVLRYLRSQAHRELGWPDGDADAEILEDLDEEMAEYLAETSDQQVLGWFEWSADPDAKRTDRKAWAQANPSMNHTDIVENCVTERAIAAAMRTNPPSQFEIEVLCRWLSMSEAGPFPEGSWRETLDNSAAPAPGSPRMVCLAMSWNRSKCYIARAAKDENGHPVAGIAADRNGTDWVIPWLIDNRESYSGIVIQSNGAPETALIDDIRNATGPAGAPGNLPVLDWAGPDLGSATGVTFDRLDKRHIRHLAHPGLDAAATSAAVKVLSQGAWVIDLAASPTDAAPLKAFIGAVWAVETATPTRKSAYETSELLVV